MRRTVLKLALDATWLLAHMDRVELGQKLLSMMWRNMVERVIRKAIEVYGLDAAQGEALEKAFLFTTMGNVMPG